MIQSIVKSVVDVMNSGGHSYSFGHTQKSIQNLQADEADLPIVFLDMPVTFNPVVTDTGFIKNVFKCSLVVLFKSNMDDSGGFNNSSETIAEQEQIEIFEKAFAAQRQFMLLLNKSVEVKDFAYNGQAFQVQHVFDCDLSGIAWSVDIEPKDYAGVCTDGLFPVPNCPASPYLIEDTDGTILYNGTLQAGQSLNVIVQDSVVSNSNDSFVFNVLSQQDLELNDVTFNVTNSEDTELSTATVPAQENKTIQLPDEVIQITDENDNIIQTINNPTLKDLDIVLSSFCPDGGSVGKKPLKTGWTTPQFANDDGVLQRGRDVDFFTLESNNAFGNTNRFTDELGGQAYFNDIVLDWSTFENGEVLGYYRVLETGIPNDIFNAQPYIRGGFSDWFVSNINELNNIQYWQSAAQRLDYTPFNINSKFLFSSTPLNTNYVWEVWTYGNSTGGRIYVLSTNRDTLLSRYFTLTELGL